MADKEIKKAENVEEIDEEVEGKKEGINIKGGLILLRSEDGGIVYEKIDDLTWEDITMFSEYLNRLKEQVWDVQMAPKSEGVKKDEA